MRHIQSAWGLILGVALVLLLAAPASAHPSVDGWQMSPVTLDADFGAHPRLSQGKLVWVGQGAGGVRELRLRDPATGDTRVLAGMPGNVGNPEMDGDHLVFLGRDGRSEVYAHTLSTGVTEQLTANDLFDFDAHIAGDLVVWRQTARFGTEGADPGSTSLLVHDLSKEVTLTLAAGGREVGLGKSALGAAWVAWNTQPRNGREQVWVYEAQTGKKRQIPALEGAQVLALAGNNLVCLAGQEPYSNIRELLLFDLAAGTKRLVARDLSVYESVQADGDLIAWAGWSDGSSYMALYDAKTDETTRVRTPGYSVGSLVLRNGLVIWQGQYAARFAGTYWSYLFAYDPARGVATRLSTVLAPNDGWDTDGRRVVFTDGNYWPYGTTSPLTLVLAQPVAPVTLAFVDVSGTHPYRTAITGLKERDIVVGYPIPSEEGAAFRPSDTLTRAQFAKMLALTMGMPASESQAAPFDDLGPDDPTDPFPHQYVAALAQAGVIQGTAPRVFSPYAQLTRAQLLTLTVRAVDRQQPGVLGAPPKEVFHDYIGAMGPFDPLHGPTMVRAELNGLLDGLLGYGRTWDPWAPATRGEAAQVLWNVLGKEGRPAPAP